MEKDCGAYIHILSNRLKARLNSAIQNQGITGVQSRFIFYILNHSKDGPVFQRDLENVFGIGRSTATGVLNLMEKNGIIVRESVSTDGRLKSLVPTKKAEELDAKVRESFRETDRILTKGLSEEDILKFKEVAQIMTENLEEHLNTTKCDFHEEKAWKNCIK